MESSDLLEIFGTLSVGALLVGMSVTFWWIFRRPDLNLREFVRDRKLIPESGVSATWITVLAFGLGIFVEGLTDFMTDSESVKDYTSATLGKESEHRFDTLFKVKNSGTSTNSPIVRIGLKIGGFFKHETDKPLRLRFLGENLFRQSSYAQSVLTNVAFLENPEKFVNLELSTNDLKLSPDELERRYGLGQMFEPDLPPLQRVRKLAEIYVNGLYYPAKNWAYSQENYYDELEKIQRRIDWARSSSLVTFILGVVGLGLSAALLVAAWACSKVEEKFLALFPKDGAPQSGWAALVHDVIDILRKLRENSMLRVKRLGTVLVVATVTWLLMKVAYAHSEEQFNERVFGYYISYLQRSAAPVSNEVKPHALAWFQTAAEYRAICLQTYESAKHHSLMALNAAGTNKRPPAVVMDIDETVLDNSAFNAFLAERGLPYSESLWQSWVNANPGSVVAVPGAVSYVQAMRKTNVAVLFISNRDVALTNVTISRMAELGFGNTAELAAGMRFRSGSSSSKEERRKQVESEYRLLAAVGDNLADFADEFEASKTGSAHDRWDRVTAPETAGNWGTKWFVLPNPIYGDWEKEVQWTNIYLYSGELRVGGNR